MNTDSSIQVLSVPLARIVVHIERFVLLLTSPIVSRRLEMWHSVFTIAEFLFILLDTKL